MSDKKETPVSWLLKEYYDSEGRLWNYDFDHALEMESKKHQKYDEMLEMLEKIIKEHESDRSSWTTFVKTKELIKEAKEL
jgi:hypothetical protein